MKLLSRIIFKILSFPLFFVLIFCSTCLANEPAKILFSENENVNINNRVQTPIINMLPINPDLLSLMNQLKQITINRHQIEISLAQLTLSKKPLNPAEQYLILVVQVLVKGKFNSITSYDSSDNINEDNVIELLEQADKLSEKISEQQLAQPNFIQLHLILAEHYEDKGKYGLAYLEKKQYLKKYNIYRKNKRLAMIASLEKSFEVNGKKASNALLKIQNELKIRRVAEVKDEKVTQQYNFTIVISIAIIFLLLFFRQLRVRSKLIRLTRTDALTGIANRSALFESGNQVVKEFTEKPNDLSVLLLDLDHFKKINDNFGNNAGDKVLMIVSKLVKETMRSRDVFSRLGGEEFVALLPYADTHKAKAIAMRINDKIAKYDFSLVMLQRQVTISIGVATMEDTNMSFGDLLHRADLAMYKAKEQGRNAVVCYQNIAASQERRAI